MDICRFINSKDIAEHLRAVRYQANAFVAAYFVEQCANATLGEKLSACKEIAETIPDCPTAWNLNCKESKSTHGFLREYAALQQRMLDEFTNGKGFVYMIRSMRRAKYHENAPRSDENLWIKGEMFLFSTFARCIDHLRNEKTNNGDDFDRFTVAKTRVDFIEGHYDPRKNEIVLDQDFQPLKVSSGNLNERDVTLLQLPQSAFVEVPVPFKRGDIVIDHTALIPHPFVFDRLKFWNSTELVEHGASALSPEDSAMVDRRVALSDEKHGWDSSHMAACGYELGCHYSGGPLTSPYDLCYDVFGACDNYLNLELYRGPLEDELKILEATSRYLKGTIGIEDFLNQTQQIGLACHTKQLAQSYDNEYVPEIRHLYQGDKR